MSNGEEIQARHEFHQALRVQLPNTWNAFFAKFGGLRDIQLDAIPPLLRGESVLITAPTAGGKTEAAVVPFCEKMTRSRGEGLSVILVTPTRALVNDLFRRLEKPFQELNLELGRKTGDHALSEKSTPRMLITTPESLESLLTFSKLRLRNVWGLIIDEIHLLDGGPRGDQLRMILQRFRRLIETRASGGQLQVAAMSATVSDPERLAKAYLGATPTIIRVAGQRELDATILNGADESGLTTLSTLISSMPGVEKVLAFVRKRKDVDNLAKGFLKESFSEAPCFGHHGSLSKSERERVETRFREERRASCVATMTLEVGIDIGDIDAVVCFSPPGSLASFLQQIGRGSRRSSGKTRVFGLAENRAAEILFRAYIRQGRLGMPVGSRPPFRRSVLVQQILAYLRQVEKHTRTREQLRNVFCSTIDPMVTQNIVDEVCTDMVAQGLLHEKGGVVEPASEGWNFIKSDQIYSNLDPEPKGTELVDADTGRTIATVAGVDSQKPIRVAGRDLNILPGGNRHRVKVRVGEVHPHAPEYFLKRVPRSPDVGMCVAAYLGVPLHQPQVIVTPPNAYVFTWLGQLLNNALSIAMVDAGVKAKAKEFCIQLPEPSLAAISVQLQVAADALLKRNPLADISVEREVTIGPYFRYLSAEQQQRARRDWLDRDFLSRWSSSLTAEARVEQDSPLGMDLLAMI